MPQNSSQPDELHNQLSGLDKDALVDLITQAATENTIVRWEIMNSLRKISVSQVASENADCQRTVIHLPQATAIVNRKSTAQEKSSCSNLCSVAEMMCLRFAGKMCGQKNLATVLSAKINL